MNISHGPPEGKRPDLKATPLPPAPFGAWRFWARKRVLLGDPGAVLGSLGGLGAVLRGLGTISGRSWAVFKHSLVPSWPLRGFDLGNVDFSMVLQGSGTPGWEVTWGVGWFWERLTESAFRRLEVALSSLGIY